MKKLTAVFMTLLLVFSLSFVGCGMSEKQTIKEQTKENEIVKVGSLKGPTSIGLVSLMEQAEQKKTQGNYEFTMESGADALMAGMLKGDLDIALIPANVASIWYQKMNQAVQVIDINTLGVLYMVSTDTSLTTIESLKGKTIVLTGKGNTPDYTLQYLLKEHGLTTKDVTLEYKSEAAEVVNSLAQGQADIGLLPQPFVTVACAKNKNLQVVMDMTEQWNQVQGKDGSQLVTGVTIVRKEFLEQHKDAVDTFMQEQKASVAYVNDNPKQAAELVAKQGIIEQAELAEKAIPKCNITYIDGADMKQALQGYLSVLYNLDKKMVGGNLPADDFYYVQ